MATMTKMERDLLFRQWELRDAQDALAAARRGDNTQHTALCEAHVKRVIAQTFEAQCRVEDMLKGRRAFAPVHNPPGLDLAPAYS